MQRVVLATVRLTRACGVASPAPARSRWPSPFLAAAAVLPSHGGVRWAGHSKWKKIKHGKAAEDKKRSLMNTKVSREITAAVRAAGPDPSSNHRLGHALDKAKALNVPKDVVSGAISRAVDGKHGAEMETVVYEGNGPAGTAFIVECLTDSRNRTAPALRHIFSKHGGHLGASGSTAWQFDVKGLVRVAVTGDTDAGEDAVMEAAIDAGAEDVTIDADGHNHDGTPEARVMCEPTATHSVRTAVVAAGFEVLGAEIVRLPTSFVEVDDATEDTFRKLLDDLEHNEDVQHVFHNGA